MRRHRPICANSLPAVAPSWDAEREEAAAWPVTGWDRREFIRGAVLAGAVVAFGWPAGAGGAEAAAWSDGTAWSDGRGWSA
jgi:hypothetical protein